MNFYEAVEKKPEHGGGWAFMKLNRRSGAGIVCGCATEENDWGWNVPGHATAAEAERCFWDKETSKPIHWQVGSQASRCAICDEWTPELLTSSSNLIDPIEHVCQSHFRDDELAASWLWSRHPFSPGIKIMASW